MQLGTAGVLAMRSHPLFATDDAESASLESVIAGMETWLTQQDKFRDVSRGNPLPHQLPEEKKKAVGLTRETWGLEVVSDEDNPTRLRKPLTVADGTALDFNTLVELGKTHAVRFAKVMSCLNLGCPLGTGIWEGVPLRTVLWMTQPVKDLRRVFYYGYHNDDAKQMFRSSLSVNRILEDPAGLPPVILCYKLNGQWLTPERGGPVRMVVPEAYGFKSIKWLSHVVLSNIAHANDTYAEQNNDVDSPIKTFCSFFPAGTSCRANAPIPLTGWAQIGLAGLSKVQIWVQNRSETLPEGDPYFKTAPWQDAEILGPPQDLGPPQEWGGGLPGGKIDNPTLGFDPDGRPIEWPMRLTKAHWAILHPGLPAGEYTIRCRTIDQNQMAQPMPRPFRKSGHASIQSLRMTVE
ncbi:MAG: molybdopterin-dependent oxidoreductase [Rubripirellula sp.]|nr:molybdopterin-dependent oxidoreductase [Rubripirellula sp.]